MSWVKLDDGLHANPKVQRTRDEDLGRLVKLWSWSAHYETDGRVTVADAKHVLGYARSIDARAFLRRCSTLGWLDAPLGLHDTWEIHDWPTYMKSRAERDNERASAAKRQRRRRARGEPASRRDEPVTPEPVTPAPTRPVGLGEGTPPSPSPYAAAPPEPGPGAQAPPPNGEVRQLRDFREALEGSNIGRILAERRRLLDAQGGEP